MAESWWRRLVGGARRLRQQHDWPHFAGADWAERIMGLPVTDRFHAKQGRSIGRLRLPGRPGEPSRAAAGAARLAAPTPPPFPEELVVYLKRHYRLPWWQGWLALLWPHASWSPGFQEWDHLEWARRQGLPVPRPVAAAQFLLPGGRLQSFLAVEELTGMLPLHEAVPLASRRLDRAAFAAWKRGLVAEMARLTRALHDGRHFHKDLYLCHFYVAEADTERPPECWVGRLHLIDLHRLAQHRWGWPWWQAKDLGQLLYSSHVEGVTQRDRLRFWRLYLGDAPRGLLHAWVRWVVQTRARNYHGRNLRKPQVPGEKK